MTKHFLDAKAWQKIAVFTIHNKTERVGEIFVTSSEIKSGENAGYIKFKALVQLYDYTKPMATRVPPIKAQGAAIGGGYDMLTSSIGSAMQKTIYAKYFKSEADGGGSLIGAFKKIGYKLDRII